jgi:hypothetical protein
MMCDRLLCEKCFSLEIIAIGIIAPARCNKANVFNITAAKVSEADTELHAATAGASSHARFL